MIKNECLFKLIDSNPNIKFKRNPLTQINHTTHTSMKDNTFTNTFQIETPLRIKDLMIKRARLSKVVWSNDENATADKTTLTFDSSIKDSRNTLNKLSFISLNKSSKVKYNLSNTIKSLNSKIHRFSNIKELPVLEKKTSDKYQNILKNRKTFAEKNSVSSYKKIKIIKKNDNFQKEKELLMKLTRKNPFQKDQLRKRQEITKKECDNDMTKNSQIRLKRRNAQIYDSSSSVNDKKSYALTDLKFNDIEKFKHYMINDFKLAEISNQKKRSQNKLNIYEKLLEIKNKNILQDNFQEKIDENSNSESLSIDSESSKISKRSDLISNLQPNIDETIRVNKKNNTNNIADIISDMSILGYQNMDKNRSLVNPHNLRRLIRVREINKFKKDPRLVEMDSDVRKSLHFDLTYRKSIQKLGQPGFVTLRFKKGTISKFNSLIGNNWI